MRQEVPTWLAAVIIVAILVIVGAAYWYFSRPRPTPEAETLPATHQPALQPQGQPP
jgi:cytoskeletal protein RodZ